MDERDAWLEEPYLYCTAATVDSVEHDQLDLPVGLVRVGALSRLKLVFVEAVSRSEDGLTSSGPHTLARATTREGGQSAVARLSPSIGGRLGIGHAGLVRLRPPARRELLLRDDVRKDLVESVVAGFVAVSSFVTAVVSMRVTGGARATLLAVCLLTLCTALGFAVYEIKRLLDN